MLPRLPPWWPWLPGFWVKGAGDWCLLRGSLTIHPRKVRGMLTVTRGCVGGQGQHWEHAIPHSPPPGNTICLPPTWRWHRTPTSVLPLPLCPPVPRFSGGEATVLLLRGSAPSKLCCRCLAVPLPQCQLPSPLRLREPGVWAPLPLLCLPHLGCSVRCGTRPLSSSRARGSGGTSPSSGQPGGRRNLPGKGRESGVGLWGGIGGGGWRRGKQSER